MNDLILDQTEIQGTVSSADDGPCGVQARIQSPPAGKDYLIWLSDLPYLWTCLDQVGSFASIGFLLLALSRISRKFLLTNISAILLCRSYLVCAFHTSWDSVIVKRVSMPRQRPVPCGSSISFIERNVDQRSCLLHLAIPSTAHQAAMPTWVIFSEGNHAQDKNPRLWYLGRMKVVSIDVITPNHVSAQRYDPSHQSFQRQEVRADVVALHRSKAISGTCLYGQQADW